MKRFLDLTMQLWLNFLGVGLMEFTKKLAPEKQKYDSDWQTVLSILMKLEDDYIYK